MIDNIMIRVCMSCLEAKGKRYSYLSIYGCKEGSRVHSCKTCEEHEHCSLRLTNPEPEDATYGYCEDCVEAYFKTKSS